MAKKPTKKELKELRRMEHEQQQRSQSTVTPTRSSEDTMKWITFGVVATIIVGLIGFIIYSSQQKKAEQERLANTPVTIENTGWVTGATDSASVTLVEFADFQCPACKANEPFVEQILADYPDDVRFMYKHFPLTSIHKNAQAAAIAAEAAGKQDKFWEMHNLLFEKQAEWEGLGAGQVQDTFVSYAQSLGLNTDTFRKDLEDKELAKKITAQQNEGLSLGVMGTPTFFINGKRVESGSYELLKNAVESELQKK